jgi:hypothetical protein
LRLGSALETYHCVVYVCGTGEYDFPDPYWTDISEQAKSLVRGLLTVDPKKRLTGEQVLTHVWIAGDNVSTKAFGAGHGQRLKLLQARRILRRTVRSVIAVCYYIHITTLPFHCFIIILTMSIFVYAGDDDEQVNKFSGMLRAVAEGRLDPVAVRAAAAAAKAAQPAPAKTAA